MRVAAWLCRTGGLTDRTLPARLDVVVSDIRLIRLVVPNRFDPSLAMLHDILPFSETQLSQTQRIIPRNFTRFGLPEIVFGQREHLILWRFSSYFDRLTLGIGVHR